VREWQRVNEYLYDYSSQFTVPICAIMQVASIISSQNSTERQLKYELYMKTTTQSQIAITRAYRGDLQRLRVYACQADTVFRGYGIPSYTVSFTKVMYIRSIAMP
jgi:ribosomal protein S8